MTDKLPKGRKVVKAELNKSRDLDIKELATLEIDERSSKYEAEKNRYDLIIEERKREKRLRDDAKLNKVHILKRKHIEKRSIAETEE